MHAESNKYRHQVEIIKLWMNNRPGLAPSDEAGMIAVATGCPVVVVVHFLIELYPEDEKLKTLKQRLLDFYDLEGVL